MELHHIFKYVIHVFQRHQKALSWSKELKAFVHVRYCGTKISFTDQPASIKAVRSGSMLVAFTENFHETIIDRATCTLKYIIAGKELANGYLIHC